MPGEEKQKKEVKEEPTDKTQDRGDPEDMFLEGAGLKEETKKQETPETETEDKTADSSAAAEKEAPAAEPEKKSKPETKEKDTESDKGRPSYEALEKALNDTKSWATGLAQELAEIKKGKPREKADGGNGKAEEQTKDDEIPSEVKDFLDDYPEAKPAIMHFAKRMIRDELGNLKVGDLTQSLGEMRNELAQSRFETQVVTGVRKEDGTWMPGHPDAFQIMASSEFREFWKRETELNPRIADYTARDAITFLTRYKAEKARVAAEKHDAGPGRTKSEDLKDMAQAGPEPGTRTHEGRRKRDEEKSPQEWFEEGVKL